MTKVSNVRRCRLCASEDVLNDFYDIFDDDSDLKLEMKIRKLLPVVVMSWDPMPHVVCRECTDKLNTFNEFYETSLNTERFLRTLHCVPQATRLPENEKGPEKGDGAPGERTNFLVTPISCGEYVYTCRRCCRTFTKETAAIAHPCSEEEDHEELETDKKSLPPLKIRLFDESSGSFVCCLCKKRFEDKEELGKHIKGHFLEEDWEEECSDEGGGQEGCCREGDEWEETFADENNSKRRRRRRKRCLWPPKKRRARSRRRLTELQNVSCEENSTQEEIVCPPSTSSTMETTEDQEESIKSDLSQERDIEMTDDSKSVTQEPEDVDMSRAEDEVTVIEVIENRIPTNLASCVFCDKIFATTDSLLAHKSKHLADFKSNSDEGDPFQCDVCPKTLPSEWTLMKHLRGHNWGLLEGESEGLSSLHGLSLGGAFSKEWGIVTSGEDDVPLVDVT